MLHSVHDTAAFIREFYFVPPRSSTVSNAMPTGPVAPSLTSYVTGLLFYANRFPECLFPVNSPRLAWLSGGSHGLWHIFIVRAISLHRDAIPALKDGALGTSAGVCPLLAR